MNQPTDHDERTRALQDTVRAWRPTDRQPTRDEQIRATALLAASNTGVTASPQTNPERDTIARADQVLAVARRYEEYLRDKEISDEQ